jgi:hypothetical protein
MQVPRTILAEKTTQDQALSLIENVFPIDLSQYTITLTQSNNLSLWTVSTQEVLTYTLESEESVFDIIFNFENNIFTFCFVGIQKGSINTDNSYANLNEAAKGFLDKYQNHNGENLTEMKRMLNYADETKNMTLISGNLTLTIRNLSSTTYFGNSTVFQWRYTINGVNYPGITLSFRNGAFDGLNDRRDLYEIGDTTINISKEQAINIAIDEVNNNYSYDMGGGITISDFNVTKDRAVAWLGTSTREHFVLYPIWNVMLYLDKRYPGSVYGILVHLWADSGVIFSTGNQAEATLFPDEPIVVDPYYGQDEPTDIIIEIFNDTLPDESTEQTDLDQAQPEDNQLNDHAELDLTNDQKGLDPTSTILTVIAIVSTFFIGIIFFRKVQKNKKTTLNNNH